MSGGINFDTTSLGGYGGFGGGYGGFGYGRGTGILDLAALALFTRGGFFGNDRDDKHGCSPCCAPATCEQVNDVDRDVLQTGFNVTEAVHSEARATQKDICDVDKDVILGDKCIEQKICESTNLLQKDIFCLDRDVLLGFKEQEHKICQLKNDMDTQFAETKCLIKETALLDQLREKDAANALLLAKLDDCKDLINKKDIVAEILAALGAIPVIANK